MAEIYSHSRLSSFEDCPQKFQYRYVLKIPVDSEGIEAFVGKRVHEILERLYTQTLRLWYVSLRKVSRLSKAIAEHRDIIAAIKAGDGERAAEIMQAHIISFQEELTTAL